MLTEKEKYWLRLREAARSFHGLYSCRYGCANSSPLKCLTKSCPLHSQSKAELQDALDFTERVSMKLAADENFGVDEDCPPNMPFGWGRLKAARLAVEEEMDADR